MKRSTKIQKQILTLLKDANNVTGYIKMPDGNNIDMEIFDWDCDANNAQDIPDIVFQGNCATIFYDELTDATIDGNIINLKNYSIQIS
jgi:hypothetical protein